MGVTLKLDDGSMIGAGIVGSQVARVAFAKAHELNRADEKDLRRLEALLGQARGLLPKTNGAAPAPTMLPAAPVPLPAPAVPMQAQPGPPAKRARVEPPAAKLHFPQGADWYTKCKAVMTALAKHMGDWKPTFWVKVPQNSTLAPNYYNVIKNPMFFSTVDSRLSKKKYRSPDEFYADVKLSFDNVKLYNPIGNQCRMMGDSGEAFFDSAWEQTGLTLTPGGDTRAAPGTVAPKPPPQPRAAPAPAPAVSQGTSRQTRERKKPAGKGHEASSFQTKGQGGAAFIDEVRKQEMGMLLMSEQFSASDDNTEALTALLPASLFEGADGSEFELDLDVLDQPTLRKIDELIKRVLGPGASAAPAAMEEEVEDPEDPDEEEEEDDDDDDDDDE
ncbi:hypothetical protein FOA52_012603 [Chlamydomonas sp. UWO 241]|nr:hypothetical protein FOA52_012603 [Chlamydomonas sp. UWO 241]